MSTVENDNSSDSLLCNSDHERLFSESPGPIKARSTGHFLFPLLVGATISSLFWGLATWENGRSTIGITHEPSHILHCGRSPAEARALGCEFQLWDFSWIPGPCCDRVIEHEYLRARDWGYYLDKDGKEEVEIAVARSGEHDLWTTHGQHFWHCVSNVMKFVRDMDMNSSSVGLTNIESAPGVEHIQHCVKSMRRITHEMAHWHDINDRMEPSYRTCYVK